MKRRANTLLNEQYIKLLQEYQQHVTFLGHSKNGVDQKYAQALEFFTWLEQHNIQSIKEVTTPQIRAYHEHIRQRPHKKNEGILTLKTVYSHMQGIRGIFALLQAKGEIIKNPMSVIKIQSPEKSKNKRTVLTIEEIKELYQHTETLQERALLSLAYGCGLRSMELVSVRTDDIKLNDNILIVKRGKGNKRRTIPLSPRVKQDLENYYTIERPQYIINTAEETFLLNIKGKPLRKYTGRKILRGIINRTGNETIIQKNISTHNLRHSIATHLLEQGVQLEKVRDFLGHSHLETTEIYTRVSQKQLKTLIHQYT